MMNRFAVKVKWWACNCCGSSIVV